VKVHRGFVSGVLVAILDICAISGDVVIVLRSVLVAKASTMDGRLVLGVTTDAIPEVVEAVSELSVERTTGKVEEGSEVVGGRVEVDASAAHVPWLHEKLAHWSSFAQDEPAAPQIFFGSRLVREQSAPFAHSDFLVQTCPTGTVPSATDAWGITLDSVFDA